jgi:hypothetical protein
MKKNRVIPKELALLTYLRARTNLSAKDEACFYKYRKGYVGEEFLDSFLEKLDESWIILNDIRIEVNQSIIQLDSILISNNTIYILEVKNYEGDYYYQSDRWYTSAKTEIKNPLLQLQRSVALFKIFLSENKITLPVEPYLLFVNPYFMLYQAPLDLPIIFPPQLERFFSKLMEKPIVKVNPALTKLADKLISQHILDTHLSSKPLFSYDELLKGIFCPVCGSIMNSYNTTRINIRCNTCDTEEKITLAIKRSIGEYQLLFPEKKLTTGGIYEWCGEILSKKVIRKYLLHNYMVKKHGRSTYFE